MNDLIMAQDTGVLTISDRDRIRISAAWEALSVNSRRSYQGAWDRCGQWLADRGISLDDLSDEVMAVYIATLDAEGRTPATISVSVAAVNVGDLKDNTLTIRQSKTDQMGEGRVLFVGDETVQVIEELKAKANISRGALFRRVLKNGKMTTTRLTPEAIREIVKKRSQGIRGVKGRVSGHSLRVGSAVSLARGNASLVEMQVDGRWKDSRMPSHYASAEIAQNSATARIKYGKRR